MYQVSFWAGRIRSNMNKEIFKRMIMGAVVVLEKHEKYCQCSYCESEKNANKKIRIVLPKNKSRNSWRRISYRLKGGQYMYLRWTLPVLSYFLGFNYCGWSSGFRIQILPAPISRVNRTKALITYAKPSIFKTKVKNVESLFWRNMVIPHTGESITSVQSTSSKE